AGRSPGTRCRAASGWPRPSGVRCPARPTTRGPASTPRPTRLAWIASPVRTPQIKHAQVSPIVRTPLCDLFGVEHPIVGFSPSEDVCAAGSRAGRPGVLAAVRFNDPAALDKTLDWMDAHTGGRPYGI